MDTGQRRLALSHSALGLFAQKLIEFDYKELRFFHQFAYPPIQMHANENCNEWAGTFLFILWVQVPKTQLKTYFEIVRSYFGDKTRIVQFEVKILGLFCDQYLWLIVKFS